MSNYTQRGSRYFVGKEADSIVHEQLPSGNYAAMYDEMMGFYLETISPFALPPKIYGDAITKAERILDTFDKRPASTGVHLDGVKGSGKTLLVKALGVIAAQRGIPSIVVNQPFHGDSFNSFIQSIDCPAIIVFDEFEKTYDWQTQTKILTLFDGVYPSKKLFLLTTNNSRDCSEFLKNRPGRMYYSLEYDVIEPDIVREVLEDQLLDKEQIPSVVKYAEVFTFLNFDMLIAIIEEMNRYDETLHQVLEVLNVQPEMRHDDKYDLAAIVDGQEPYHIETLNGYDPARWSDHIDGDDLAEAAKPANMRNAGDDDDDHDSSLAKELGFSVEGVSSAAKHEQWVHVGQQHLVKFDGTKGVFTYEVKWGRTMVTLTVTRDDAGREKGGVFNFNAL